MSKNELEKQLLEQIQKDQNLLEGLSVKILKLLMRPKMRRALKKLEKHPEMKAAIKDAEFHHKNLLDKLKGLSDDDGRVPKKYLDLVPKWY
jgi:hypothetical protein